MKKIIILFLFFAFWLLNACSQSGRRKSKIDGVLDKSEVEKKSIRNWEGKAVVKMEKKDGVYQIPIWVNDVKMHFIFDTGAGMVSISETEANFLYKQGTLTESDFIGTANFMDANGDVSEGAIINLKSLKIGGRTLNNVKASVVHNLNAPLLLGQTVLEQFGKISINYNRGEITLE